MTITLFLYSRLYLVSMLIFLFFQIPGLKSKKKVKRALMTSILTYLLYLAITSYILYVLLNGEIPDYIEIRGLSRINRLLDTSNWIRFTANFRMLESLNFSNSLFGIQDSIYFPEFENKTIYPHNLFLGLTYNVGIIWAFYFFKNLVEVTGRNRDLFYTILLYQLILGFGSFYFYVLPMMALTVQSYEKNIINRR